MTIVEALTCANAPATTPPPVAPGRAPAAAAPAVSGSSRQEFGHGDPRHFAPLNDQRYFIGRSEILSLPVGRAGVGPRGVGVDFYLAVNEVQDPVTDDSRPGIEPCLLQAVTGKRSVRHFDHEGEVLRTRVTAPATAGVSVHDSQVRLRLTVACGDGRLD